MAVRNFRSETVQVFTRLAWSGFGYGELIWRYPALSKMSTIQLSKCLFCFGGERNFFFLKIEEHPENQTTFSNERPFSIPPRKQKNWLDILGILGTSVDIIDIIMFSDIPISLSTNQDSR